MSTGSLWLLADSHHLSHLATSSLIISYHQPMQFRNYPPTSGVTTLTYGVSESTYYSNQMS